jgi:hypothetical protein
MTVTVTSAAKGGEGSVFLTVPELRQLTGRARPKAQVAWLREHRVRHYVNAAGQPVVAWAWIGVGHDKPVPVAVPDFAALA